MFTNIASWKITRDLFYYPLLQDIGEKGLLEAGFYYDIGKENINVEDSVNILCTPLEYLRSQIKFSSNPCIIISTGAFNPIHQGHIEMMQKSRKYLMSKGYDIIAGYLSPSHDRYIKLKCGDKSIKIPKRLEYIKNIIKDLKWLNIDPWEGVFNEYDINFTDVLFRLEKYIIKHLKRQIPIFYVCGGDNAKFSTAFLKKGQCIVVNRPGASNEYNLYKLKYKNNHNIHFVELNNNYSSTEVRKNMSFGNNEKKLNAFVRLENKDPREKDVLRLLRYFFASIYKNLVDEQRTQLESFNFKNTISLDPLIKGDFNLEISRIFDLFGINKLNYTERPGSKPFEDQIKLIDKSRIYKLVDDDIYTGKTIDFAKKLLSDFGVRVNSQFALNALSLKYDEVIDLRDFIIGGEFNGLVIQLPNGNITRAPYLYPYVDPYLRASIDDPMNFSIEVWKINLKYFKGKQYKITDFKENYELYKYIGFNDNTTLYEICKWHYDYLKKFTYQDKY